MSTRGESDTGRLEDWLQGDILGNATSKELRGTKGRGVPPLCPRLGAILGSLPGAGLALLAAALRGGANILVLKPGRFRLLYLAWVQGRSLSAIGDLTNVTNLRAVRQRLVRVSDAVETWLAAEVAAIIGDPGRMETPNPASVRDDLLHALQLLALS